MDCKNSLMAYNPHAKMYLTECPNASQPKGKKNIMIETENL
jgi:hypothetical protein